MPHCVFSRTAYFKEYLGEGRSHTVPLRGQGMYMGLFARAL